MIPSKINSNILQPALAELEAAEQIVNDILVSKGYGSYVENAARKVRDQKQTWQDAFNKKAAAASDLIYLKILREKDSYTILDLSNLLEQESDLNRVKRCVTKVDKSFTETMELLKLILKKINPPLKELPVSEVSELKCKEAMDNIDLKKRKAPKREPLHFTFSQFHLESSLKGRNLF